MDKLAWPAIVHSVTESDMTELLMVSVSREQNWKQLGALPGQKLVKRLIEKRTKQNQEII